MTRYVVEIGSDSLDMLFLAIDKITLKMPINKAVVLYRENADDLIFEEWKNSVGDLIPFIKKEKISAVQFFYDGVELDFLSIYEPRFLGDKREEFLLVLEFECGLDRIINITSEIAENFGCLSYILVSLEEQITDGSNAKLTEENFPKNNWRFITAFFRNENRLITVE